MQPLMDNDEEIGKKANSIGLLPRSTSQFCSILAKKCITIILSGGNIRQHILRNTLQTTRVGLS